MSATNFKGKNVCQVKEFVGQKFLQAKEVWVLKNLGSKNMLVLKNVGFQNIGIKMLDPKVIWVYIYLPDTVKTKSTLPQIKDRFTTSVGRMGLFIGKQSQLLIRQVWGSNDEFKVRTDFDKSLLVDYQLVFDVWTLTVTVLYETLKYVIGNNFLNFIKTLFQISTF